MEDNIAVASLREVSKIYNGDKIVLGKISVCFPESSIVGLIGLNGSGKSTLFKLISGLDNEFDGEIQTYGNKVRALIERPVFYDHLTAFENLEIICLMNNGNREEIDFYLKAFDLYENANQKFYQFSMGMKQRLGVLSTFLSKPDLVLLDEPINGLDPHGIDRFDKFISQSTINTRCIIISSHNLDKLEDICTHYMVLKKGSMVFWGTKEDIKKQSEIMEESFQERLKRML